MRSLRIEARPDEMFQHFSRCVPNKNGGPFRGPPLSYLAFTILWLFSFFVPLALPYIFIINPLFLLSPGLSPILYVVFRTVPWSLICTRARPVPMKIFIN